jgi:coatomer subunit beta
MSSSDATCYTIITDSSAEYPSVSELRSGLEKGSDEVKLETLRKIIISTMNGNPQVPLHGLVFLEFIALKCMLV